MNRRHVFRWILTPLACLLAWELVLVTGILLAGAIESVCPEQYVISGHHCAAPWTTPLTEGLIAVSAAAAAVCIVLAAVFTAPTRKRLVAAVTFAIGSLAAIALGVLLKAWIPMLCAFVAGALALRWARWRYAPLQ